MSNPKMSNPKEGISDARESVRRRLIGDDLSDSDVRSLQLRMDALDRWARLGDAMLAGHDHDHMDDHDHAMASPLNVVVANPESQLAAGLRETKAP